MRDTAANELVADIHQSGIDERLGAWLDAKMNAARENFCSRDVENDYYEESFLNHGRVIPELFVRRDFSDEGVSNFKSKQNWTGHVVSITDEGFEVRLKDLTNGGTDEIAVIEFDDIGSDDRALIKVGAIIYLSIGRLIRNGQVINQQVLRFKRTVPWSGREVDAISDEADSRINDVDWD